MHSIQCSTCQTCITIHIIRLHGPTKHGKGLIDAKFSFVVKSILHSVVIAFEKWFDNSKEICS